MNIQKALLLCSVAFIASGCASVKLRDHLVTLDQAYFSDQHTKREIASRDATPELVKAYRQITVLKASPAEGRQSSLSEADPDQPLPTYLANDPLIRKLIIAAYENLVEERGSSVEVTKGDLSGMTGMLKTKFVGTPETKAMAKSDSTKKIGKLIQQYLTSYYSDKDGYINREGTVFKRPEIKNSIGNDVITAFIAIILEGLFDGLLENPVYVDKGGGFQTSGGLEPSAHKYKYAKPQTIVERGKEGVDDLELKAIRYLCGLASDQSKALSGAAYRSFGGITLSFVIGGKFSFGDNDTLAKVLDTAFEVASKRIVEEGARRGFEKLTVPYPGVSRFGDSQAEILLREIN